MAYKNIEDQRQSVRNHYNNNKQYYKDKAKRARDEKRAWIAEYKESRPCMDCGVSYPACVMDFDHRDPTIKSFDIATSGGWVGWQKIIDEIEKCDVICANCHRLRTHKPA